MTMNAMPYGFRVVGDAREGRRLTDWAVAFRAHCEADERAEPDKQSYLSTYHFGCDFRDWMRTYQTPKGYRGACFADWLWLDIDRDGDPQRALTDARRLLAGIVELYRIDGDELLTFYSGGKGYHVGIPTALFAPTPSERFAASCKRFALTLAERIGVEVDAGVYDRQRLFRSPNSRHGRTGLHKRRLTADELMHLSADGIQQLAAAPEAFELPKQPQRNEQAATDWADAAAAVDQQSEAKAERQRDGTPKLNRLTFEFIRDGACKGDRHRQLFSAAANLAEFDCTPELAEALLLEAALDCGLTPSDARRQIECGLHHDGGDV